VNRQDALTSLKTNLKDPVEYFLGENFEGVLYPDFRSEYYGIPPNKSYVFSDVDGFHMKSQGLIPLSSFAQGGLAQAWTGGVYPFNDDELRDFPFRYGDIEPYYNEVAKRIGITGAKDDLGRFLPIHKHLLNPLKLDEHSALLLSAYEGQKSFLNGKLRFYLGRSRTAALSQPMDGRRECSHLGRCLWGCPTGAFYTPSITLNECKKFANFQYLPDLFVHHFKFDSRRRVTSVVAVSLPNKAPREFALDKLVLAAGTLSSSNIFLTSIYETRREIVKLPGLMDNRQVLIPFVNLKMIGKRYDPETYQYHQLAFGVDGDTPREYRHGLITTLKTALYHPIIQNIPFDLKTSIFLFRNLHAALGLVNLNFHDTRRNENFMTLEIAQNALRPALRVNYTPPAHEASLIHKAIKKVKKALGRLKCIVPPGMVHVRPMGASVHYSGTIPMSRSNSDYTTSEYCQSHDFNNLYIVDGTTFPFLPAKNITFTLMANAVRVAECNF
jgi:hypothetical protein